MQEEAERGQRGHSEGQLGVQLILSQRSKFEPLILFEASVFTSLEWK